jgi:RNA polymerase sigma factor (sigma-70 family)
MTLTRDEQSFELVRRHRAGDKKALAELCALHTPLIKWAARRYANHSQDDYDDLTNDAWVGFLEGVDRVDLSTGSKFSGYVASYVIGRVARGVSGGSSTTRSIFWNLSQVESQLLAEGIEPTNDNVAPRLGVSAGSVAAARSRASVESVENVDVGEIDGFDVEAVYSLHEALGKLTARDREVVEARYLRDEDRDEVGRDLGISRQRVQQLEARAMTKLREVLA